MDQALYISKLSSIKYFQNDFTRIYFGQEFCERLLPQKADLENNRLIMLFMLFPQKTYPQMGTLFGHTAPTMVKMTHKY